MAALNASWRGYGANGGHWWQVFLSGGIFAARISPSHLSDADLSSTESFRRESPRRDKSFKAIEVQSS